MLIKARSTLCGTLASTLFLFVLIPSAGRAEPLYQLQHFVDTYNSSTLAPGGGLSQASPINYDFAYQSVHFQDKNFSEVHATVHRGSVGIFDRAFNNGTYAPQRQEVGARYEFDVVFSSAGTDPINVQMHLDLSGSIVNEGSFASTVNVNVGLAGGGQSSGGSYGEASGSPATGTGMLSGFTANGATQTISTGVFSDIPVNQPVRFFLGMGTINPYQLSDPRILFGNTLNLATTGDVFTISGLGAGDVTGVDSLDAGIVNNSFTAVPEPATDLLLALAGLAAFVRRQRSKSMS